MKKLLFIFTLFFVTGMFVSSPAMSAKKEITFEQAVKIIADWQAKVDELTLKVNTADGKIDGLKKELEAAKLALADCNKNLYSLVEASLKDIADFRQRLGQIEGKVRSMQRLSDDVLADRQDDVFALEAELNVLRGEKMSLIPEFYNKIIRLAKDINPGLIREKVIKSYTVGTWSENRDCLWNIAGKNEIYGDPFQWSKIWQSNTDIVRNPDIILPGQVMTLPDAGTKTDDEDRAERRYWREKREAMEAETGAVKGE